MKAADIVVGREYAVAWVSRNETEQGIVRKAEHVVVLSAPKGTHVMVARVADNGLYGPAYDVRVREIREPWETFKEKVTYWQNYARDLMRERMATAEREEAARQRIAGMGVFDMENGPLRYRLADLDHQKVRVNGDGSGVAQVEVGLRWSDLEAALNKAYTQGYEDADSGLDAARGEHS